MRSFDHLEKTWDSTCQLGAILHITMALILKNMAEMLSSFRTQPVEYTQYQYFHIQCNDSDEAILPSDQSM